MDRARALGSSAAAYAGALALVAGAEAAAWAAHGAASAADVAMLILAGVLFSGAAFGLGPALLGAVVAILGYNFFFLAPRYTFAIGRPEDLLTFGVFLAAATVTGWLAGRARDNARIASGRAASMTSLLRASQRLSAAATPEGVAQVLAEELAAACGAAALVFLPGGRSIVQAAGAPTLAALSPAELAGARRAWTEGTRTGAGGPERSEGDWAFRPLEGLQGRSGVAALRWTARSAEDLGLIESLLGQGAVALERAQLAAGAVETRALRRSDQLRAALLNSISHDLRTPLATILGSSTTLLDYGEGLAPEVRRDLLQSVREEAERLNRYVRDLLDMTRVEGGGLSPRRDLVDVREVLVSALDHVRRRAGARRVEVDAPDDLSMVRADPGLLEQAVVNILENAIAYTPPDARIEVAAHEDRGAVVISVEDDGPGVPASEVERLFDKFHRMEQASDRRSAAPGAGLGLPIAKGFVEAMGGQVAAASPVGQGRGIRFMISLPKQVPTAASLL